MDTPLGKDVLLLQELTGERRNLAPVQLRTESARLRERLPLFFTISSGRKLRITLHLPDGTPRYISGYVSRFTQGETDDRMFTHYHAQVVPWLWFLTRQADCRIFQNLAVPDIISQVFNLFDFKDFRLVLEEHVILSSNIACNIARRRSTSCRASWKSSASSTTSIIRRRESTRWCWPISPALCRRVPVLP